MKNRLVSIDVLRGMTIAFMVLVNTPGSWTYVYSPLKHAIWHGCTPTDLVFPFFIFTVGLSMAFSLSSTTKLSKSYWSEKILKRTLLIFLVGFLLNWFPFYHKNILDVRLFGVLQRIALSYGLAAMLVLFIRKKSYLFGTVIIGLIFYLVLVSVGGDFTLEGSLNRKIDAALFPLKNLYGGFGIKFDPEGILGIIPSSLHVIIGYLIGSILKTYREKPFQFLKPAIVIGVVLLLVGHFVLGYFIPINKPLWTPSYVVYTSGIACLLLCALVYTLDVLKVAKWSFPFKVLGRNALASFVLSVLLVKILLYIIKTDSGNGYSLLFKKVFQPILGDFNGSLGFALFFVGIVFTVAYTLYKKNIMIKL